MAESHKFKTLPDAEAVFPDLPWQASETEVSIYNSKEEVYVPVSEGQYIVKIADRYEVHDEEPAKAKPAEPVEAEEAPAAEASADAAAPAAPAAPAGA